MPIDTEVTSTDTETPSEEGQVAAESQETPEGAPAEEEAATEPAPEAQPSAEEEEDAKVKAAIDAQFGEAPPPTEEERLSLTSAEIAERERRAAQSAADSARAESQRETQRQQEIAQARGRIRADLGIAINEHLKKIAESGEVPPGVADDLHRRFGGALYQEAVEYVTNYTETEFFQALAAVPGMTELTDEDVAPLKRGFARPADKFGAAIDIAVATTEKRVKAEMADEVEKRANRMAREKTEAALKQIRAEERGKQSGGELPKGEATGGRITDEEMVKHQGDDAWWEANREVYFAQRGLKK